ncbi:MAG: hypothetical protein M0P97_03545 [Candidatus Moranbacteria bacterium]|jgi:capsular polysaccharide biosynthesis protein|nr:hypothetical protein [Candidatus Moranbacteria bacterium]
MELKEYIAIFKKNIWIFLMTILVFWTAGAIFYRAVPEKYKSTMDLNISRTGVAITGEEKEGYDYFYRLQADDIFSETVVGWLNSPRVISEICNSSGATSCPSGYEARKVSAQLVQVVYVNPNREDSDKIAQSLVNVMARETGNLNLSQKNENWFEVLGNYPFIEADKINFNKIMLASLILGIFFGFWMVFMRHYFKR